MHDTIITTNALLFLCLWLLSVALLYLVIKTAVRNGVQQANERLVESVRAIEKTVYEMKKAKEK